MRYLGLGILVSSRYDACVLKLVCSAVGEWRRLVAHLVWDQGVAGSNPVSPTIDRKVLFTPLDSAGGATHHSIPA